MKTIAELWQTLTVALIPTRRSTLLDQLTRNAYQCWASKHSDWANAFGSTGSQGVASTVTFREEARTVILHEDLAGPFPEGWRARLAIRLSPIFL